MQSQDLFLDRSLCDKPVNSHRSLLPNPMSSVGSLIFHRWIPPWIKMDHIVSTCKIQTSATCFQGNQEQFSLTVLELVDKALSFFRRSRSIEVLIRHPHLIEFFADH